MTEQAGLRGDIEGLRAIAVLMVLAFHVGLPGADGGFAGVDVFFVISGYLITGQLVREALRSGRVDLVRFYARRARRLLPAATLVLVVTTVAGWTLLPRGRHADLGAEVLAATGYVVNWLLAAREVDYLAEDQSPSLVQHYWSLSVEEQFYVLWPVLIIAVLWVTRRMRLRLVPVLALVLGTGVAASAAWSVLQTAQSPGTAYFATTTRAWQLGVGAALVLLTPLARRLPPRVTTLLAGGGVLGIAATIVVVDSDTAWPGSAAALPTLATAAVIAAGLGSPANPVARLLGIPVLRFLGALSYGLYLWHWPLLALLAERVPEAPLAVRLAVVALAVLLAWATLRWVENPIRFSRRLSARPGPALRLGATAMATSAVLAAALLVSAPRLVTTEAPRADGGAISLVDPGSRTQDQLRLAEGAAAAATAHTDTLTPDPAVVDEDISLAYRQGCQVTAEDEKLRDEEDCTFGDPEAEFTVAVVGDSKMEQWSSALHAIGRAEGWRVIAYTKSACGFVDEGRTEVCHAYNQELSTRLGQPEHAPDLVITSLGQGYPESLQDSMIGLLQPATDAGAEVVLVADTPLPEPRGVAEGVSSYACLDQHRADYSDCWSGSTPAGGTVLLSAVADQLDAPLVELLPWICPAPDELGGCAPVVGGVVVNRQGSHLSASYVRSLTPLLHHELIRIGVASTPYAQVPWRTAQDPAAS